jgi:hypothetical protein
MDAKRRAEGELKRVGAYREANGPSFSTAQRRVMSAIELCRTAALGGYLEQCDRCERLRPRHCPFCPG